jgi:hypothetical protein
MRANNHHNYYEGMAPYITGGAGGVLNMPTHHEYDDHLLMMDELDIDELLECDDIEQTAFINSSKHLLSVIDTVISSIDDRISYKRQNYYGPGHSGYYGAHNNAAPGYDHHHGGGYHKQSSQSTAPLNNHSRPTNHHGGGGRMSNAANSNNKVKVDGNSVGFDKTRKISVLY